MFASVLTGPAWAIRRHSTLSSCSSRLLLAALVYVNTLMIQDLIDDPDTGDILVAAAKKRGVTPLFWEHVLPYGEVELNMSNKLTLGGS